MLGLSYAKIADQIGVSQTAAYGMVKKALADINEKTAETTVELRTLETERLDRLLVAIASKASQGHLGAVDRALKIMDRRTRLWGLDAPRQIKANVNHGPQRHEIDEKRKDFENMEPEELIRWLVDRFLISVPLRDDS